MPYTAPAIAPAVAYATPAQMTPRKSHTGRNLAIGCVGLIVLLVVVVIAAAAANHDTTGPTSPAANTQQTPSAQAARTPSPTGPVVTHTVLAFSGTGYETTQPFKIPSSEWTLSWTIKGDPQYAQVSFEIYNSNGDHVDSVDATPGTDSASEHQGNDVFFMDILDANAVYNVKVTADYAGADETFSLPAMTKLTTVSGSGDKSSKTFQVTGSIWRIDVHANVVSQYTAVTAYVESAADNSDVSQASVEGAQGGRDTTSYVYVGPGSYYIKVLSANTGWTVTVEQTSS